MCRVLAPITLTPIGVVRTPFADRVSAPRQPCAAGGARGTIELLPGRDFEHALSDLEGWDRIWVVFAFHLNPPGAWRPKVLPPRSAGKRRGVFSTRSPHRPNPIGLSVVRLDGVAGLSLHVRDVDMIDGTPVLDLKPYVPYADAFPDARTGWLEPLAPGDAGGGPSRATPSPASRCAGARSPRSRPRGCATSTASICASPSSACSPSARSRTPTAASSARATASASRSRTGGCASASRGAR